VQRRRSGLAVVALVLLVGGCSLAACGSSSDPSSLSPGELQQAKVDHIMPIAVQTSDGPSWCRALGSNLPLRQLSSALEVRLEGQHQATANAVLTAVSATLNAEAPHAATATNALAGAATALDGLTTAGAETAVTTRRVEDALTTLGRAVQSTCHFQLISSSTTTAIGGGP